MWGGVFARIHFATRPHLPKSFALLRLTLVVLYRPSIKGNHPRNALILNSPDQTDFSEHLTLWDAMKNKSASGARQRPSDPLKWPTLMGYPPPDQA